MKLSPYAWVALAFLVTVSGFAAGRALQPDTPAVFAYKDDASPYTAPPAVEAVSRGGFSGFGAAGIEGATTQAGRVTTVQADNITIASADGIASTIRLTGTPRVFRIEPATAASLRPGTTIAARLADDGETIEALLILAEP